MSKKFESGVKWFTQGTLPPLNFPEDDVCCKRCLLYNEYKNRCLWTNEKIPYPEQHIGAICPIQEFKTKE